MPKEQAAIEQLSRYLPQGTFELVLVYLRQYKVHLTITVARKSILGDYRHKTPNTAHRISINGNLNPYSFLITLLHELAHLIAFEQYNNRIAPHGQEWKACYSSILQQFLQQVYFPADIRQELATTIKNPAASSCAEDSLLRVLRKYNADQSGAKPIEELPDKTIFKTQDGRIFVKEDRLRKRYKCKEISSGKVYLFSPLYEVEIL